jgi:6-phosphofructokinase
MEILDQGPEHSPPVKTEVFVSHCLDDKKFVFEVCDFLDPYLRRSSMYLFEQRPALHAPFHVQVKRAMEEADVILIFTGRRFGENMSFESVTAGSLESKMVLIVDIGGRRDFHDLPRAISEHLNGRQFLPDSYTNRVPEDTIGCAKDILAQLELFQRDHPGQLAGKQLAWSEQYLRYGLPASPHVFDYEKDIIRFYLANRCYERLALAEGTSDPQSLRERYQPILDAWPQEKIKDTLAKGIAPTWPKVWRYSASRVNPLQKDRFRGETSESFLRANALLDLDVPGDPLVFPEAGPRPRVALPREGSRQLKVAIVVAGGIAPGINAVIDAIVQRHEAYCRADNSSYALRILGLKNGLLGIDDGWIRTMPLTARETVEHATLGGSMLGTSRDEGLLSQNPQTRAERIRVIAAELKKRDVDIDVLYFIGGDGSMKAAHALWHKVNSSTDHAQMSVVAIPKTMDNDILWVWQSFGFLSAVQEAREIIERLYTEVRSNPRLGIVQFFGSGSGFVVSHAVLAAATGHTTLALIPEIDFSVIGVARYVKQALWRSARPNDSSQADPISPIDSNIPHGLIVMAETAIPLDAMECLGLAEPPKELTGFYRTILDKVHPSKEEKEALTDFHKNGRRVQGQTSDHLRSLGIKLLHQLLPHLLKHPQLNDLIQNTLGWPEPKWDKLRMVRNEPRYLVRALEPFTSDIITGQRMGILAVDAAMAGYTDCMVSQWLTEFSIVPLDLVVLGRKRIPPSGMFWKSVTDKTGQPDDLVSPYPRRQLSPSGNGESSPPAEG